MSKRPIPNVAGDFAAVTSWLKARGLLKPDGDARLESAKRIHRATYSLILWRFRLPGRQEHRRIFAEELGSDALQILPQALAGYSKTTALLTRGVIENAMRHLYFSDHPVEYRRMNRERKWYLQVEDLFDYALNHHEFIATEPRFDALNRLKSLYSELSAAVHGRRVEDLEMRLALDKIVYTREGLEKATKVIEACAESVNFVLSVYHRDRLRKMRPDDRRTILQTMSSKAKLAWTDTH